MTHKSDSPDSTEVWLTIDEACEHFRLSRSTFYRLLARPESELAKVVGRLPGSGRVRVPMKAVERLLRTRPPRRARRARADTAVAPSVVALVHPMPPCALNEGQTA